MNPLRRLEHETGEGTGHSAGEASEATRNAMRVWQDWPNGSPPPPPPSPTASSFNTSFARAVTDRTVFKRYWGQLESAGWFYKPGDSLSDWFLANDDGDFFRSDSAYLDTIPRRGRTEGGFREFGDGRLGKRKRTTGATTTAAVAKKEKVQKKVAKNVVTEDTEEVRPSSSPLKRDPGRPKKVQKKVEKVAVSDNEEEEAVVGVSDCEAFKRRWDVLIGMGWNFR